MLNATVSGYVGNVKLDNTQGGRPVLNFSVAHQDKKDSEVIWIRCSLFGTRAETLSQYIVKGTYVTACGTLKLGIYNGKNGAVLNSDMMVSELSFINKERDAVAPPVQSKAPVVDEDLDVPF